VTGDPKREISKGEKVKERHHRREISREKPQKVNQKETSRRRNQKEKTAGRNQKSHKEIRGEKSTEANQDHRKGVLTKIYNHRRKKEDASK